MENGPFSVAGVISGIPLPLEPLFHRSQTSKVYLRWDKVLSVSAIKGYHSALNQIFALKRYGSLLLSGGRHAKQDFCEVLFPSKGEASRVGCFCCTSHYELLQEASDKDLTLKTLFLLAPPSAKWVGNFTAYQLRCAIRRVWHSLIFPFMPVFVANLRTSLCLTIDLNDSRCLPFRTL